MAKLFRLAISNQATALAAPSGWLRPPSSEDQAMALTRLPRAMYSGRAMAKPSAMLWTNRAMKTLNPSDGLAWLVAYVMKPSGSLCRAMAMAVWRPMAMMALVGTW